MTFEQVQTITLMHQQSGLIELVGHKSAQYGTIQAAPSIEK